MITAFKHRKARPAIRKPFPSVFFTAGAMLNSEYSYILCLASLRIHMYWPQSKPST